MKHLILSRLKSFKCPNCKKDLMHRVIEKDVACIGCDFTISQTKFDEIVSNLYKLSTKNYG